MIHIKGCDTLTIAFDNGVVFEIPATEEYFQGVVQKNAQDVEDYQQKHRENQTEVCNYILDAMDRILNADDATDKIFEGITLGYRVILNVYCGLMAEIIRQYRDIPGMEALEQLVQETQRPANRKRRRTQGKQSYRDRRKKRL